MPNEHSAGSSASHWIAARLPKKSPTASKNASKESPREPNGTPLAWHDRQGTAGHRRRLDDRRRRLPEQHEPVDDLLEVLDVADVGLHEEAVLAGDAVALDHLGRLARELCHLGQLA